MMKAAIYCRISRDREGAGLGVQRQEDDCRALARQYGWTVSAVHTDNDLSAYSGKPRPGYRQLLDEMTAGQLGIVVAWHTDRLHRSPSSWRSTSLPASDTQSRRIPSRPVPSTSPRRPAGWSPASWGPS